jgi:hypothetical protein
VTFYGWLRMSQLISDTRLLGNERTKTMKELLEFLNRQASEFDTDMRSLNYADDVHEYAYAMGARDAYIFVLRYIEETGVNE